MIINPKKSKRKIVPTLKKVGAINYSSFLESLYSSGNAVDQASIYLIMHNPF